MMMKIVDGKRVYKRIGPFNRRGTQSSRSAVLVLGLVPNYTNRRVVQKSTFCILDVVLLCPTNEELMRNNVGAVAQPNLPPPIWN